MSTDDPRDRNRDRTPGIPVALDPSGFEKLNRAVMPFGKYAGRRLIDLPEHYLIWFATKGYPAGELGDLLRMAAEIRENGLEYLFRDSTFRSKIKP